MKYRVHLLQPPGADDGGSEKLGDRLSLLTTVTRAMITTAHDTCRHGHCSGGGAVRGSSGIPVLPAAGARMALILRGDQTPNLKKYPESLTLRPTIPQLNPLKP